MTDTEYLAERAQQELSAAMAAVDRRARDVHFELAGAYSFRLRQAQAIQRRSATQPVEPLNPIRALQTRIAEIDDKIKELEMDAAGGPGA